LFAIPKAPGIAKQAHYQLPANEEHLRSTLVLNIKDLFSPCNLMAMINHLADNKADGTTYAT
jgi:hypothetical protein